MKSPLIEDFEFDFHKTRPLVVPSKFVFHGRGLEIFFSIEDDLTICCSKQDPFIVYFYRRPHLPHIWHCELITGTDSVFGMTFMYRCWQNRLGYLSWYRVILSHTFVLSSNWNSLLAKNWRSTIFKKYLFKGDRSWISII